MAWEVPNDGPERMSERDKPERIAKLEREPCRCVMCGACGGSGYVWVSDFRIAMEPCDFCSGGIIEVCDRCQALDDYDSE